MCTRGRELVAADKPAVMAESLPDSIVVKNGEGDGGLPNPSGADESDWAEVFGKIDCLLG